MENIKNVLSIDMDYIMGPSIELYNNLVGQYPYCDYSPEDFWDKLNEFMNIERFLTYDEAKLLDVVRVFSHALTKVNAKSILFATEHDMILNLLSSEDRDDEKYEIYNFDHHHDIYYDERQKEEAGRFSYASPANWVYYLGVNDRIEGYHWIRNKNSAAFPPEEQKKLYFPIDIDSSVEETKGIEFDYIFVCFSKKYFPNKFQQYFDMLRLMAEEIKGTEYQVCTTPFCIDGKPRIIATRGQ